MSRPGDRITYGTRETVEIDGETYIKVPTTVEILRGGWVRFHDVIPGAFVDVLAVKPDKGQRWRLMGVRVDAQDGRPISGADLSKLSAPVLAERAREARTMNVEAIVQRSRREVDRVDRIKAVQRLLAEVPRAEAVRVLIDDTGVSRAGAYRWVREAEREGEGQ